MVGSDSRRYVQFDTTGADALSWFAGSRVTSTYWTSAQPYMYPLSPSVVFHKSSRMVAIESMSSLFYLSFSIFSLNLPRSTWVFSLPPVLSRTWFIHKAYGGCQVDEGIALVNDASDECYSVYGETSAGHSVMMSDGPDADLTMNYLKGDLVSVWADIPDIGTCKRGVEVGKGSKLLPPPTYHSLYLFLPLHFFSLY